MRQFIKTLFGLFCVVTLAAADALALPVPAGGGAEAPDSLRGTQYFRRSDYSIQDIAPALRILAHKVDSLYSIGRIDSLVIRGNASPDGPAAFNRELALKRASNVERHLAASTTLPASKIRVSSCAYDWTALRGLLQGRPWSRADYPAEAVGVIDASPAPEGVAAALRAARGGDLWAWLDAEVFPLMRATSVIAFYDSEPLHLTPALPMENVRERVQAKAEEAPEELPAEEEATPQEEEATVEAPEEWRRHIYLKTNLPAWLCLWLNAAVEIDLAPHFSATLPVYYSGFNYFTRTLKFRTFALQPEVRYWPRRDNHGFFVGAHLGMAYYDVALKGEYRYQDKRGRTPALGGGLAIGWRFPLGADRRLWMEATAGGGIYHLDYDIFQNRVNGLLTGHRTRTFYGLDQVALSITYRFGLGHRPETGKGGAEP